MSAPFIAISPNAFPAEDRRFYKRKPLEYGDASMAVAVERAGGVPIMPYRAGLTDPATLAEHADRFLDRVDGLLLSGGADVAPTSYGEEALDPAWEGDALRDAFEIALYRAAIHRELPVLGICRGIQLMNVAEGGTLWQDIEQCRPDSLLHRNQEAYDGHGHAVEFEGDSLIAELFDGEPHEINSVHHQGLKEVGAALTVLARAPDGIVEAVVREGDVWAYGVQWHPEWMLDREGQRRLFEIFVERCGS